MCLEASIRKVQPQRITKQLFRSPMKQSASHCNTLKHTETIQHTATHCNTLQVSICKVQSQFITKQRFSLRLVGGKGVFANYSHDLPLKYVVHV